MQVASSYSPPLNTPPGDAPENGTPAHEVLDGHRRDTRRAWPEDIDTEGGWEGATRSRIVPALREVTAYAVRKGVEVTLQNHGDMTATADQTLQVLDWVGDPNLSIMDDTGYFRPFQAPTGTDYTWYRDIMKVLPRSTSIQVKRKPAGADSDGPMMDYQRLFTGRLSGYRATCPASACGTRTPTTTRRINPHRRLSRSPP
ncbi:hypothetical protein ACFU93_45125 [Streptomyces sp. NPDC057611]|uniref:hypothetical protein n=1 Tax=Streptomyces sp. NPDC057611 TaxID=3346182 RepID=UPI00367C568D